MTGVVKRNTQARIRYKETVQKRNVILRMALTMIALSIIAAIAYLSVSPLPCPIPRKGQVVDATTGQPIAGATLKTRWRLYDYPMLDGAGSYELSSVTITNKEGEFALEVPDHRRGLWNTELRPPMVTAKGYKPFDFDNPKRVQYTDDGGAIIIQLTPDDAPD
jgi:hypothetical protein